jgi:hypothetical protein
MKKEVMGVGDKQKINIKGNKENGKKTRRKKNAKRKANYQVRISLKCNKELKNIMHNFFKNCFFSLKMWKVFIHGQNHTKHKVGPNLSLDPFYFC